LVVMMELLRRAREAGMSAGDLTLVTTLLSTHTIKEAAERLGVTDRTIRNRRKAVVDQLRALADVA
jgi:transcription initiation factor TFIIIB Brf1 subunit/transcription initiation factor TFIIB